jgi:hypothetical protein
MSSPGAILYRLWVREGQPFEFRVPWNMPVEHDGGTTVVHLMLKADQVSEVSDLVASYGCEFDLIPHETQSQEQTTERLTLLGLQRGGRIWPSASCPSCGWFDPLQEMPCGRASWPPETIRSFETLKKASSDLDSCPVSYVWRSVGG